MNDDGSLRNHFVLGCSLRLRKKKKDCMINFIATTVPCFGPAAHARHVVLVLVVDTTSS
jgi:hypothetical protein